MNIYIYEIEKRSETKFLNRKIYNLFIDIYVKKVYIITRAENGI